MAKRRYCTSCVRFSIFLNIDGKQKIVQFGGKDVLSKERYFDTEDKQIQKALETASGFGVYFYRSGEYDWMEAEETQAAQEAVQAELADPNLKTFASDSEAKAWISKIFKIPYVKLATREMIVSEYEGKGLKVKFENI